MHLEVLEGGVRVGGRCVLRHVELVVDVAVQRVPLGLDCRDRLARELERDRLVPKEAAADRVGDDRALIADDRVVDTRRLQIRAHRLEHPPGDDEHVDPRRSSGADGVTGPGPEDGVLGDQRPVEIAGERLDAGREVGREGQPLVACTTYAATSAICFGLSWPEKAGMGGLPFVTRLTTRSSGGFASSRFGPTVPDAPASLSVWQLAQPADAKIFLPAAASPFTSGVVGTLPATVCGFGETVLPPEQPASTRPQATRTRARRRTGASLPAHKSREPRRRSRPRRRHRSGCRSRSARRSSRAGAPGRGRIRAFWWRAPRARRARSRT